MGSTIQYTRNHRPRLLYICGSSFLSIACKAYQKAEEFGGPVGSLVQKVASMTSYIVTPVLHYWLSMLAFIDDQILAAQDMAIAIFPSSEAIFSKLDDVAHLADHFPKIFDDAIGRFAELIHDVPLSGWAWRKLDYLFSTITNSRSRNERDIMVDIKCDEQPTMAEDATVDTESKDATKLVETDDEERHAKNAEDDIKEVENACREIMGELEKMGMVDGNGREQKQPSPRRDVIFGDEAESKAATHLPASQIVPMDPILDLFNEAWQEKRSGGKKDQ